MKKLLTTCLLLLCSATHAEVWLEASNKSGGKIVLMQDRCEKYPALRVVLTTTPEGRSMYGCWGYAANMVQVVYNDGSTYTYPPHLFELKENK